VEVIWMSGSVTVLSHLVRHSAAGGYLAGVVVLGMARRAARRRDAAGGTADTRSQPAGDGDLDRRPTAEFLAGDYRRTDSQTASCDVGGPGRCSSTRRGLGLHP
jgi:hypothetical protein